MTTKAGTVTEQNTIYWDFIERIYEMKEIENEQKMGLNSTVNSIISTIIWFNSISKQMKAILLDFFSQN